MRYVLVFLLAALIAGGAAMYYRQQARQLATRNAALVKAEKASADRERQVKEIERERERTIEQQKNLMRLTEEMGQRLQVQHRTITNMEAAARAVAGDGEGSQTNSRQSAAGGIGKMVASMMQDPETRQFIREQQRVMMDQLYTPLFKRLGLNPEQSDQFKTMLLDNMMRGAEKATGMFGGGTGTDRAETMKALAADHTAFEDQVRAFLGEDGYAQYKDYSTTIQERTQLNMFRQQMAGNENPITDQQTELLLAMMREEKQKMGDAIPEALKGGNQNPANMQAIFDETQTARLLEAQESVNARVQERAGEVLAPDQLSAFARFQTNQMSMMRMGLSMARKMFGENPATPGTSPANQPGN